MVTRPLWVPSHPRRRPASPPRQEAAKRITVPPGRAHTLRKANRTSPGARARAADSPEGPVGQRTVDDATPVLAARWPVGCVRCGGALVVVGCEDGLDGQGQLELAPGDWCGRRGVERRLCFETGAGETVAGGEGAACFLETHQRAEPDAGEGGVVAGPCEGVLDGELPSVGPGRGLCPRR